MRWTMVPRFVPLLLVTALATGCTGGDGGSDPDSRPTSAASGPSTTLASLSLGWPRVEDELDPGARPATPAGFDDPTLDTMAATLTDWATATSVDQDVWDSIDPLEEVGAVLPEATGQTLASQVKDVVSPRLAVANVFADDVTVVGAPQVTTAWKVSTADDEAGKPFVLLELQTRVAYEVRLGQDGPTRVIGVLRVHGLSAFADTTDDFGVSGGWQEFGAGDCALALDDALLPDSDPVDAAKDLKTFVSVGNGKQLVMPPLGVEEQVDPEYLRRCRDGQV